MVSPRGRLKKGRSRIRQNSDANHFVHLNSGESSYFGFVATRGVSKATAELVIRR
ncbi:hypothetical protein RBSH_05661 [Rhodopirellula baltica SH28]|uniref:Uncharacterized protein n=1 Tax=Rhodopirellula baltica SH28 TaxID=993517 RepID=K5D8A2_RHOBT|nr:hypothetical protein RBSH_05661 [Rhodopirellula baltica SH28]